VQTTFIFNDLSIPNFILGEFEGFEKPVGQFRPNVQYLCCFSYVQFWREKVASLFPSRDPAFFLA
jgi:hypothetical protein